MAFRLGLAQCGYPADGDVIAMMGRFCEEAAEKGCSLLAFPEDLMSPKPLSAEGLRALAEPADGPFVAAACELAQRFGLWLAVSFYERNGDGAPFNTAAVISSEGELCGSYRKVHLYDAHGVRESSRTTAGAALPAPVEAPFATLGVGICYDLRFPEMSRALALGGCDLLLFPSAWYAGPEKVEHWETLLRARAIENELFVAGVCHAGKRLVGRSLVADPLGRVIAQAGENEELLVCTIDLDAVGRARDVMPVFEHRRSELYG